MDNENLNMLCNKLREGKSAGDQPRNVRNALLRLEKAGLATYSSKSSAWVLTDAGVAAAKRANTPDGMGK